MRTLLPVFLIFFSISIYAAVPDGLAGIEGRFIGQAYNGLDMDPVITELAFDSNGRFVGTYAVESEDGNFEGRLSNLIQEGPYVFSLEWTDRYGEGFVLLEFNADYSSFNGFWSDQDSPSEFPWNGRRQ